MTSVAQTALTDAIQRYARTIQADEHKPDTDLIASTAVHELREPVQAILSFLSVLLEGRTGPLSELQTDFLETASQATRRLSRRIDDLHLVLTERSDLSINPVETDLVKQVHMCCHELSQIATSYGVRLEVDSAGVSSHARVWTDPDRTDQILLNIIENAIQYSMRGKVVKVSMKSLPCGDVCVTVRNSVEGKVSEDPSTWFLPRLRGQSGVHMRSEGQGLGLAAARKLVLAQSGTITARMRNRSVEVSVSFPVCNGLNATNMASFDDVLFSSCGG